MSRPRLAARSTEKQEQAAIILLLKTIGAKVYVLGHARPIGDRPSTMQTPGIPDLCAFIPNPGASVIFTFLWIEVKADGGRLREAQCEFAACCAAADVAYICGGIDAVVSWLTARGWLRQ